MNSIKISQRCIYLIFFCFLCCDIKAQTVFVPEEHEVYSFLLRMETRKVLGVIKNNTLPMTRQEISESLKQIVQSNKFNQLSKVDLDLLRYFLFEFKIELETIKSAHKSRVHILTSNHIIDVIFPDFLYKNNFDMLSIKDRPLKFYLNPIFHRKFLLAKADSLRTNEQVYEATNGIALWGTLGNYLGFSTDVRDTKEWGNRDYPGERNFTREGLGFVRGGYDHIYHDENRASLVYSKTFLTLQVGKDKNRWGPGMHGQLMLSDRATSYELIKLQVQSPHIKLTSLMAWLKHYTPEFFIGDYQEKSFAAHRLEIVPFDWFSIGLSESVVFTGRRWEITYLTPVMFFRSAEHYQGDRDNATMGIDAEIKFLPRCRLYGEFFIDDLKTSKLGTDFYGNKYAWLTGIHIVDPLRLANIELFAEYAKLRPFTYSHKFGTTAYVHYNTGLGHWAGPNSDLLFLQARYRPHFRLDLSTGFQRYRHGDPDKGYNSGGDIFYRYNIPTNVPFLSGNLKIIDMYFFKAKYRVITNGWFIMNCHYYKNISTQDQNRFECSMLFQFNF